MKKKRMAKKASKKALKSPPLPVATMGSSLGFTELREAILVNPMMVYELLSSMSWLSAQSGLPLKKYSIHTSIHMPITKAYIIDDELKKQLIHFYGSAEEIQQDCED